MEGILRPVSWLRAWLWTGLALLAASGAAHGQTPAAPAASSPPPGDAGSVLTQANNAFEYRDFDAVVRLLKPWVHPPRIADPEQMKRARRLLGISLHIKGDVTGAREEFSQVLLVDPDLELDPFVVPPAVIETFEAVKRQMKAVLDPMRDRRPPPPGGGTPRVVTAEIPHPAVAYLPFGIPQFFVLDQAGWGGVWLGAQLAGLATNIAGFWLARNLRTDGQLERSDVPKFEAYNAVQFAGLGLFGAAWLGSGIQGHLAIDAQAAEARRVALSALPGPPGTLGLQLAGAW